MITDEEIERLRSILLLVRKSVGWSAEEFGERIGVTRQTINNLENGKYKLSKTQYIAMRSVLDTEMEDHPEDTEMLKVLLDCFVDNPDHYTLKEAEEIYKKTALLSPAITSEKGKRLEVSKEWKAILNALGIISTGGLSALVIGAWKHRNKQ